MYILRYVLPIIPCIFFFIILLGLRKKIIFELETVKIMDLPWFSMNPSYFRESQLGAKDIL